jgi:hypothetical protein
MSGVEPAATKINEISFSLRRGPVLVLACCAAWSAGHGYYENATDLLRNRYNSSSTATTMDHLTILM